MAKLLKGMCFLKQLNENFSKADDTGKGDSAELKVSNANYENLKGLIQTQTTVVFCDGRN